MAEKVAAGTKREKISKAQQLTMLEVLGASLVLGTCLVLMGFIGKYIEFNSRVITEKNEAISDYSQVIKNVGICVDTDKNGRLDDKELEKCDANAVQLSQVPGSLRYNVLENMALDENLESVARKRNADCYDEDGKRRDFNKEYDSATDATGRQLALQGMKICSSLRVVSDALPAQKNTEALMASLNQIFITSGWEPESIAPRDEKVTLTDLTGVEAIPVTLRVNGDAATVIRVINNIDRSIRDFDVTSATIEWNNSGLSLQARANAYYLDEIWGLETIKTIRAGDKK